LDPSASSKLTVHLHNRLSFQTSWGEFSIHFLLEPLGGLDPILVDYDVSLLLGLLQELGEAAARLDRGALYVKHCGHEIHLFLQLSDLCVSTCERLT